MEGRQDRSSMDDAQKAKLIFISLGAVVLVLLVFSFIGGNKARTQRDAALKEVELLKSDNIKLSQWLEERTQEMEKYRRSYEDCRTKLKHTTPAKKTTTRKPAPKKPGTTKKPTNRR